MGHKADAMSFIRNHLKYKATKCYVAGISAAAINNLWLCMNETEYCGIPHTFYCGRINVETLRAAFMRELSYNPLRFETVTLTGACNYPPRTYEIVNSIYNILNVFTLLWPNGIDISIDIVDTSDRAYSFLRELRDCFKEIARQNIADLKNAEYRDEIVARFAKASDIQMPDDIREELQRRANSSAARRVQRRDKKELSRRISSLEKQVSLHRTHDREFCLETQAELEDLKQLQKEVHAQAPKKTKRAVKPQPKPVLQPQDSECMEPTTDFAEREKELLLSMTPEHTTDDIFQDYMEQMVGLRLYRAKESYQH